MVTNGCIIAALTICSAVITVLWIRADLLSAVDSELTTRSHKLVGLRLDNRIVQSQTEVSNGAIFTVPAVPFRPRLFDAESKSLTQFASEQPFQNAGNVFTNLTYQGGTVRVYTRNIGNGRVLQYAYSLAETERAIAGITRVILLLIPVGVVLASIAGYTVTVRTLRPVESMVNQANAIQFDSLEKRIPIEGSDDELSDLARTFNELLHRIEAGSNQLKQSMELQKRFTADASHELRTPLAVIRGRSELALDSAETVDQLRHALQIIARTSKGMTSLVDDLLLLARSDAGHLRPVRESVDVLRTFEEVTQGVTDRRIHLNCAASSVVAEPEQLRRVLMNLVENSRRHTSENGTITLSSSHKNEHVLLTVSDDGEGIPPEHLPHVFERFYRADASRNQSLGSGLGLAICKEIVEAHGGQIWAEKMPDKGAKVLTAWPL